MPVSDDQPTTSGNITATALVVEIALGLAALIGGLLVGRSPLESVALTSLAIAGNTAAAAWGLAATAPMLAMLLVAQRCPWEPFVRLRKLVDELIVPLFRTTSIPQLAIISLAAGVGEEMLFRGFAQSALAQWWGDPEGKWIALIVASVIFGGCHWITPTYALLATMIGVYLGWLFILTDNLLAPIVAHALYDFVALVYLIRWRPRV